MSLKNKKAIVTGGLNGIGRKVAETLLEQGTDVLVLDIAGKQWENINNEWRKNFPDAKFHFLKCDICNREEVISSFEQAYSILNGLDIVINNVGIFDEGNWEMSLNVNFIAVVRVSYIGINLMSKAKGRNGGVIINSASVAGLGSFAYPVYSSTKHGITSFTRSIAVIPGFLELHGVRVNSVCLGGVQTQMQRLPDFKQSTEPDALPSIDIINKLKTHFLKSFMFENMISVDKAASLYLQIIKDTEIHGKNLYYFSNEQEEPIYHTFNDLF